MPVIFVGKERSNL